MTTAERVRGDVYLACGMADCPQTWTADSVTAISKRAARHLNKKHGDDLRHGYEAIDEVVFGGHHLTGHSYAVRKYEVYLTAFDVAENVGAVDGLLVPANEDRVCRECYHEIPDDADRVEEDPDDKYNDVWACAACVQERVVEHRASVNQHLSEWCG